MDDDRFIARINRILAEQGLSLPRIGADAHTDSEAVDAVEAWAGFLRECVRAGIELADPRWKRLQVVRNEPVSELALESENDEPRDDEFKVGLQLLMGLFPGRPPR